MKLERNRAGFSGRRVATLFLVGIALVIPPVVGWKYWQREKVFHFSGVNILALSSSERMWCDYARDGRDRMRVVVFQYVRYPTPGLRNEVTIKWGGNLLKPGAGVYVDGVRQPLKTFAAYFVSDKTSATEVRLSEAQESELEKILRIGDSVKLGNFFQTVILSRFSPSSQSRPRLATSQSTSASSSSSGRPEE